MKRLSMLILTSLTPIFLQLMRFLRKYTNNWNRAILKPVFYLEPLKQMKLKTMSVELGIISRKARDNRSNSCLKSIHPSDEEGDPAASGVGNYHKASSEQKRVKL